MKSSLGVHQHLDAETMGQLLNQELPRAEAFLKVAHLHLCKQCRNEFKRLAGPKGADFLLRLFPEPPRWDTVEPHASAAFASWHAVVREEEEATSLFKALSSSHDPLAIVENDSGFWSIGLTELLLSRSRQEWYRGAGESTKWARVALVILRHLEPDEYPRNLVRDRIALASVFLAQGLRVERQFADAWRTLNEVEVRDPTGEEAAWYFTTRACLLRDARRFGDALRDHQKAASLFHTLGLREEALKVRASHAITLVESNNLHEALECLRRLMTEWKAEGEEVETIVRKSVLHNYAYALALLGESFEAAKVQSRIRQRFAHFDADKPYLERRARWLDALIAQGLGQGAKARRIFRQLRDEFLEAGVPYDAALVALDLAVVCLNEGRTGEAARLALESGPIFEAHGTSREGWMAFCILIQSLKAETATVAQVHEVIDRLRAHQAADLPET